MFNFKLRLYFMPNGIGFRRNPILVHVCQSLVTQLPPVVGYRAKAGKRNMQLSQIASPHSLWTHGCTCMYARTHSGETRTELF